LGGDLLAGVGRRLDDLVAVDESSCTIVEVGTSR
jgi:hypothetical protein